MHIGVESTALVGILAFTEYGIEHSSHQLFDSVLATVPATNGLFN